MSSKFLRLVVPMMGAVTPGLARIHAVAICAMLAPFFFASSSTLSCNNLSVLQIARNCTAWEDVPANDRGDGRNVEGFQEPRDPR